MPTTKLRITAEVGKPLSALVQALTHDNLSSTDVLTAWAEIDPVSLFLNLPVMDFNQLHDDKIGQLYQEVAKGDLACFIKHVRGLPTQ